MDSMEFNKIAAAILVAGIIAMVAGFVAKMLIPVQGSQGEQVNLFSDVAPAPTSSAPATPKGPEPITALLASATMEDGAKVAKKCTSCHTFEEGGAGKVGPNLFGVFGGDIAAKEFAYSPVLAGMEGTWNYDNMNEFLYKPRDFAKGTKMSFAGLRKASDRAAIVLYMRSFSANPLPLPE